MSETPCLAIVLILLLSVMVSLTFIWLFVNFLFRRTSGNLFLTFPSSLLSFFFLFWRLDIFPRNILSLLPLLPLILLQVTFFQAPTTLSLRGLLNEENQAEKNALSSIPQKASFYLGPPPRHLDAVPTLSYLTLSRLLLEWFRFQPWLQGWVFSFDCSHSVDSRCPA